MERRTYFSAGEHTEHPLFVARPHTLTPTYHPSLSWYGPLTSAARALLLSAAATKREFEMNTEDPGVLIGILAKMLVLLTSRVAWEGEDASSSIVHDPSGWGRLLELDR